MPREAATIGELGNGRRSGEVGIIRVEQGNEEFSLDMIWDDIALKWISEPLPPVIISTDGDWTGAIGLIANIGKDWQYWGGVSTNLSKWMLRAGGIPFAGALIAAGLKLQDRASGRMRSDGAGMMVAPWFYEYNDTDPVIFLNDQPAQVGKTWNGHADDGFEPSPANIGHGAVLLYDGSGQSRIHSAGQHDDGIVTSPYHLLPRGPGWDYVRFYVASQPAGNELGGVPTNVPYTPIKKYLYPTLYGRMWNGQGIAAYSWECRWVS